MDDQTRKALSILKSYSGIELKPVNSEAEKQELRSSLKLIVGLSDYQNFGICASNSHNALTALQSYLIALGYESDLDINQNEQSNSVYLKFSTERQSYNISEYQGEYRGVLITIFADFNEAILGTYGHFPLDLFDD